MLCVSYLPSRICSVLDLSVSDEEDQGGSDLPGKGLPEPQKVEVNAVRFREKNTERRSEEDLAQGIIVEVDEADELRPSQYEYVAVGNGKGKNKESDEGEMEGQGERAGTIEEEGRVEGDDDDEDEEEDQLLPSEYATLSECESSDDEIQVVQLLSV